MSTTIYHNPRCSKSRATLELLHSHAVDPQVVEYLKSPPDVETLGQILSMLGLQPRELMRRGESVYKELGLDDETLSEKELIRTMCEHPILIERPIVVSGNKARIGRPPENVLDLFAE